MIRNMQIVMVFALAGLLLAAALLSGCPQGEEEDPAMALVQQAQQQTGGQPPPVDAESAAEPVGGEAAGAVTSGEAATAEPAAEGDADAAEDEEAAEEADETADEGAEADEEVAEPAEDEGTEADEEAAEESAADAEAGDAAAETEALTGDSRAVPMASEEPEDEEPAEDDEAVSEDPVENFKNLDPRDIIIKKYEDLESRKTEPWNPEDEGYIPNTGRIDPLTRVRSAVPDELKPPRAGETDMNEINTYLIADAATMIVDQISMTMQCHNVIQIGLSKYASFSYGGGPPFPLEEGFSTQVNAGSVNGIPIMASIMLTSVSADQVVLRITAFGQGTATSVTKNQTYIPRTAF